MIRITEVPMFGQIVTAVINETSEQELILDLRKGEVSDHARQCARYHASKQSQGLIKIERVNSFDSFIKTVEV